MQQATSQLGISAAISSAKALQTSFLQSPRKQNIVGLMLSTAFLFENLQSLTKITILLSSWSEKQNDKLMKRANQNELEAVRH